MENVSVCLAKASRNFGNIDMIQMGLSTGFEDFFYVEAVKTLVDTLHDYNKTIRQNIPHKGIPAICPTEYYPAHKRPRGDAPSPGTRSTEWTNDPHPRDQYNARENSGGRHSNPRDHGGRNDCHTNGRGSRGRTSDNPQDIIEKSKTMGDLHVIGSTHPLAPQLRSTHFRD